MLVFPGLHLSIMKLDGYESSVNGHSTRRMESESPSASNSQLTDPCEICKRQNAKYNCPGCFARTCSLVCVRQHRTVYNCDGLAKRTRMVNLDQYDALTLLNDYRFLEEAKRVATRSHGTAEQTDTGKRNKKKIKTLVEQCAKRRIKLEIAPAGMEKTMSNTSVYNHLAETIFWRIEWILVDAENFSVEIDRNPESVKLETLLRQLIKPRRGCEELIAGFEKDARFAAYRFALESSNVSWRCYMKLERSGWTKDTRYHKLDLKKTVNENLSGKAVIEYPTIYVAVSLDNDLEDPRFPLVTDEVQQHFLKREIRLRALKLQTSSSSKRRKTRKDKAKKAKRVSNGIGINRVAGSDQKDRAIRNGRRLKIRTERGLEQREEGELSGSEPDEQPIKRLPASTTALNQPSNDQPIMQPLRRLLPVRKRYNPKFHPKQDVKNSYAAVRGEKRKAIDDLAFALINENPNEPEIAVREVKSRSELERPKIPRYPDLRPQKEIQIGSRKEDDYFSLLGFHYNTSDDSEKEEGEL